MIILTQIPLQKNKSLKNQSYMTKHKTSCFITIGFRSRCQHQFLDPHLTRPCLLTSIFCGTIFLPLTSCQDPREVRSRRVPQSQVLSEYGGRKTRGENVPPSFSEQMEVRTGYVTKINEVK